MIDFDKIVTEITELNVPVLAKETGANLVDEWIRTFYESDKKFRVAAVELGFVLELDSNTIAVGVQDLVMQDANGYFGNEWKNVKEPRKDSRGRDSSWWNEDVWLKEISTGPQLGLYALALRDGTFFEKDGTRHEFREKAPRIRVRAAVKSNPVRFWPSDEPGVYQFDELSLDAIRDGFLAKAEQIRCARKSKLSPWQLPGHQCFPFNRTCPFLDKFCASHAHPELLDANDKILAFDQSDPAYGLAIVHINPARFENPNLVVLSTSAYTLASECLEKYRLISGLLADKNEDEASSMGLAVGTVAHAGYASFYRQLRDEQREAMQKDDIDPAGRWAGEFRG